MKKQLLLIATFLGLATGFSTKTEAQAISLLGPRLIVNEPGSLQGNKDFTYSSDQTYSGYWGRALDSTWLMVPLIKAYTPDTFQSSSPTANAYADKWVLIFRGNNISFSDKALYAQQGGAKGVIIVNNIPGAGPIGMGDAGSGSQVHIPVLMVSNYDGLALDAALNDGDSVKISLTQWGFNFANDLCLVPHSMPFPHAGAFPFSQLSASSNTTKYYNMYTGGIVANVGTNDENNVVVNSNITWTPTGGSASTVFSAAATLDTLKAIDSLGVSYSTDIYHPTAGQTGVYNVNSYITYNNTDDNPSDDSISYPVYVTDSVFCKSSWDNVKGQPMSNGGVHFASGNTIWGPLFYITNGGFVPSKFQFSVDDGDTSKHDLSQAAPVTVYMFKWSDDNSDNLMQQSELTLVSIGNRAFDQTDSNSKMITFPMYGPNGVQGTYAKVDSNQWYWCAIDAGSMYIGADIKSNYYGRENAALFNGVTEYGAPNANGTYSDVLNGQAIEMIPYDTSADASNASFRQFDDLTPATALHFYQTKGVAVHNVSKIQNQATLYPNPATEQVHVKLSLSHASDIWVNIANASGLSMLREKHTNVQNDDLSFSIANLAPGQYYMVITTDQGPVVRPFTVLPK